MVSGLHFGRFISSAIQCDAGMANRGYAMQLIRILVKFACSQYQSSQTLLMLLDSITLAVFASGAVQSFFLNLNPKSNTVQTPAHGFQHVSG